ncbi:MAG: hypothetical protein M0Q95_17015 [Porticoccaceae bacterium]|nr:hypothetical protein [Porticoccaceae bacterium]
MTPKLPINLSSLLHHRTIESERVEDKAGWNPDDCMDAGGRATQDAKAEAGLHSIPAFANDSPNLRGSGADAEVGRTPTKVVS